MLRGLLPFRGIYSDWTATGSGCRPRWLSFRAAAGRIAPPAHHAPHLEALQQRGLQHESAYLAHLEAQGRTITHLAEANDTPPVTATAANPTTATHQTLAAMQSVTDAIAQATVTRNHWLGRADVLLRVDTPSNLGNWSYEVVDTKLARETRAGTILQLSLYTDIIGELQGKLPEQMHVVAPGRDFEPESHRVLDYAAYYRHVRRRLEDAVVEVGGEGNEPCYPEPVAQCDICRWWAHCRDRRRADDHPTVVASNSRLQVRELEEQWHRNRRGSGQARGAAAIEAPPRLARWPGERPRASPRMLLPSSSTVRSVWTAATK